MAAFAPEDEPLFQSYLWRLNIGAEHQGKGYGRFAVEALCQEAMRRGQHRLTVSYHPTALNFRDLRLLSGDLTGRW
jgi:diamine N-acetyltransferase